MLTEDQELLVDCLAELQVEEDAIIGIGLMLQDEADLEEMLFWLHDNWDKATTASILSKAVKITDWKRQS